MSKMSDVMISAADALSAVERHLETLDIGMLDGWVEEILYLGDGFLVMYAVTTEEGDEAHRFSVNDSNEVSTIELAEYDLGSADAMDLSMSIPDLMDLMQEQDPM